jgi:hypothetical protein
MNLSTRHRARSGGSRAYALLPILLINANKVVHRRGTPPREGGRGFIRHTLGFRREGFASQSEAAQSSGKLVGTKNHSRLLGRVKSATDLLWTTFSRATNSGATGSASDGWLAEIHTALAEPVAPDPKSRF